MKFRGIEISKDLKYLEDLTTAKEYLKSIQDNVLAQFEKFIEETREPLKYSFKILKQSFDSDPVGLEEQLSDCIAYSFRIQYLQNDANTFLLIYEIINYEPKKEGIPEAARKNLINLRNLVPLKVFNLLKLTAERLDKRISCLQSVLKAEVTMLEKGIGR